MRLLITSFLHLFKSTSIVYYTIYGYYCCFLFLFFVFGSSQPDGDANEVFSCCGDGETARTVRLLRTPETGVGVADDGFADKRPILAVVKRGRYEMLCKLN